MYDAKVSTTVAFIWERDMNYVSSQRVSGSASLVTSADGLVSWSVSAGQGEIDLVLGVPTAGPTESGSYPTQIEAYEPVAPVTVRSKVTTTIIIQPSGTGATPVAPNTGTGTSGTDGRERFALLASVFACFAAATVMAGYWRSGRV
jgi:hypothetical protein